MFWLRMGEDGLGEETLWSDKWERKDGKAEPKEGTQHHAVLMLEFSPPNSPSPVHSPAPNNPGHFNP